MSDGPDWFAPKRYGYGAGLPISWQGWVLTFVFVALFGIAGLIAHRSTPAFLSIAAILITTFMVISSRTTKGGWRWRWGDED